MKKIGTYLKKSLAIMLMMVVGVFMLTACSPKQDGMVNFKIVCTTFPQYDWVCEIVKDVKGVEVTLLQDNGVDLHSYQATADDMIKIKESNLFIYVGGESDDWIAEVVEENTNPNFNHMNLMSVLGEKVKMEEIKEGMETGNHDHHHEGEESHDHEYDHEHEGGDAHKHDVQDLHDQGHEHNHEHDLEADEHIWLSLKNAKILTVAIADKLASVDTENAEEYQKNASEYIAELDKLDRKYLDAVLKVSNKTLIFGDRFPFRYLVDDYGIDYYAAFVGCSAETEASFETVAFLTKKVDELGLNCVVTIDGSSKDIAKTIIANSKNKSAKIITLNSMQTVDSKQIEAGTTYIGIMKENLKVLKEALK